MSNCARPRAELRPPVPGVQPYPPACRTAPARARRADLPARVQNCARSRPPCRLTRPRAEVRPPCRLTRPCVEVHPSAPVYPSSSVCVFLVRARLPELVPCRRSARPCQNAPAVVHEGARPSCTPARDPGASQTRPNEFTRAPSNDPPERVHTGALERPARTILHGRPNDPNEPTRETRANELHERAQSQPRVTT